MLRSIVRAFVLMDASVNFVFGGRWPETLSCRWARRKRLGCKVCHWLCRFLSLFEEDHCERTYYHYVVHLRLDKAEEKQ